MEYNSGIFYTYVFLDQAKVEGEPVYVGKGQNARFLDHLRSKPELLGRKLAVEIEFHESNEDALDTEARLISDLLDKGANLLNVQIPGSRAKRPIRPEPEPEPEWFEVYAASFPAVVTSTSRPVAACKRGDDPCEDAPELSSRFNYKKRPKLDPAGFKEMVRATIKVESLARAHPTSRAANLEAVRMRDLVSRAKANIREGARAFHEYQTVAEEPYTFRSHDWDERRSYDVTRSNLERAEYQPRKFMEAWIPDYPGNRRLPTIPTTKVEAESHWAFRQQAKR